MGKNNFSKKIAQFNQKQSSFVKPQIQKQKIEIPKNFNYGYPPKPQQKTEVKKKENKPNSMCKVTLIDIETGVAHSQFLKLNYNHLKFDFNNEEIFNPDQDSQKVSKDCFEWIFNPIGVEKFLNEIQSKKIMILQRYNTEFSYDQKDYMDNILSLEMILEFISAQDQMQYGQDIDVVKYINGKRHTINPSTPVNIDLVDDFFTHQRCSLRLPRPQEFSESLSKLMCLGDELFQCDTGVNCYATPYPVDESQEQGFAPHYDDIDAFLLQLEGSKHWELSFPQEKKELLTLESSGDYSKESYSQLKHVWSGDLRKGDLLYMPRGIIHQGKTKIFQGETHSLHVTLSNQQHNSWSDLLKKHIQSKIKTMINNNIEFRKNLPNDIFDESSYKKNSQQYNLFIDQMSNELKQEFQYALDKWQSRFQNRRMAPQEILQPNEIIQKQNNNIQEEKIEQNNENDQNSQNNDDEKNNIDDDDDEDDDDDDNDNYQENVINDILDENAFEDNDEEYNADMDFDYIRLASKNAAFVKKKINNQFFAHYSAQNTRVQQQVPKQKIQIPLQYVDSIQKIIKSYPEYLAVQSITENVQNQQNLQKLLKFMAFKQIFVVK